MEDQEIERIKASATGVLATLAAAGKTMRDETREAWALFPDDAEESYLVVWPTRELELLIAPAADLPRMAAYQECVELVVESIQRCRRIASHLAATVDETAALPYGGTAPKDLAEQAADAAGGNLPSGVDCLAVEVVRQAFLASGDPVLPGIPALYGFTDPAASTTTLPLEELDIPAPRDVPAVEEYRAENAVTEPAEEVEEGPRLTSVLVAYEGSGTKRLHEQVKLLGPNWCRVMEGSWIVKTDLTVDQVRERLGKHVGGKEKLFVAELGGAAAWQRLTPKVGEWMKARL